jgi:hypothetical protein
MSLQCFENIYVHFMHNNQINFYLILLSKAKKTLSKNVWKSSKSYKLKQKCSIKHSNELKNNTSNFSLIQLKHVKICVLIWVVYKRKISIKKKKNSKKITWFNLIIKVLIKKLARIYDIVSVIPIIFKYK